MLKMKGVRDEVADGFGHKLKAMGSKNAIIPLDEYAGNEVEAANDNDSAANSGG